MADRLETQLQINTQVQGIAELNRLITSIEQAGGDVESLRQSSQRLNQSWQNLSTNEQSQQLRQLTTEAQRLNNIAQARITLGIDTDDRARQQIIATTRAYETLRNSGTLSSRELARASQLHTRRIQELENQLNNTHLTMADVTAEFGKVTAAAGGLAYVTKEAIEFEKAMANVKKVVDGTPEQIENLAKQIQQMSKDMGMSSKAVAEIAAQGGQLGVSINNLEKFTEIAGKMSVAFNMTAEEAGNAAAKMANVFGIPILEVEALGDAINTLGNNTAAKEKDIVESMVRIGGTAKQFGLATEQAASLAAAFISLGKTPETASTAINALLTKLQTAHLQTDEFKKGLESIGLSANQLASDINANPQKALSNFLATLSKLDKQHQAAATFRLFGQEYVDDISILVGGLTTYNKALELTQDKTKTAGAMQKEFEAKMSTTGAEIDKAKASLQVLAQTIGQHLLPVVAASASMLNSTATAVNNFAEQYPVLTKLAILIASGQIAMIAFSSAMRLAGATGIATGTNIVTAFTQGAGAINLATLAQQRFNAATIAAASGFSHAANTMSQSIQGLRANGRTLGADIRQLGGHLLTLNGLFTVAAGWTIGHELGSQLYESSSAVRAIGDEMARVLAYGDAIFTSRTFDDVRQNFMTSAESAKILAESTNNASSSTEKLIEKHQKAAEVAKKQAETSQQLKELIQSKTHDIDILNIKMQEMARRGRESSQAYQLLAAQLTINKAELKELQQEYEKTVDSTKKYRSENMDLVNNIRITEATVNSMNRQLAEMESQGLKNTSQYKDLSKKIEETKNKLDTLKTEAGQKNLGELMKTDLDKASEAFEKLGLDASEFSTGIDTKTNKSLEAFITVARLADNDIHKLARAYNAAKEVTKDNITAQLMLEKKLLQVTEGNHTLAKAVRDTAKQQKDAKLAIDEQATALDKLGISMNAINQRMSKSGEEMVNNLKSGIVAIKEQATSAESLKTALTQALDTSLASAKTKQDFVAIRKAIDEAGIASNITAEQMKILNAGMVGGADKVKQITDEIAKQSKALTENSVAKQQQIKSAEQVANAEEKAQQATLAHADASRQLIPVIQANAQAQINSLQQIGATAEQTTATMQYFMQSLEGRKWGNFASYLQDMTNLNSEIERQVSHFNNARNSAIAMAQALNGANISTNDLAHAQLALQHATQASVAGIVKMDKQTLDNLKNAIDSTRQRMQNLANEAKNTADNLEASLAKLRGDDNTAMRIEQSRKLAELAEKLNQAKQRGNQDEIQQLERALGLQRQINVEEVRQAEIRRQQEQQRNLEEAKKFRQKELQRQEKEEQKLLKEQEYQDRQRLEEQRQLEFEQQKKQADALLNNVAQKNNVTTNQNLPIVNTHDSNDVIVENAKLVALEIRQLKRETIEEFMRTLQSELKRMAR